MYRETCVAAALANALEELQPSLQLTAAQTSMVWSAFDKSMTEVLNEAPAKSSFTITAASSPPIDISSSPAGSSPAPPVVTPDVTSTYSIHDGLWTIILKDAKVTIRNPERTSGQLTESIDLKYLKCYLKDASVPTRPKRQRTE